MVRSMWVMLLLLAWHAPVLAEPHADPLGALLARIDAAWRVGPGMALAARVAAERRAHGAEAGAIEVLTFEITPEVAPGAFIRSEVGGALGVGLRPFGVGFRRGAAAALTALAEAEEVAAKAAFAHAVIVRHVAWLAAELAARQLAAHLAELERDLGPLREAARSQLVDALTVDGLEVEIVRLGLALERARSDAAAAAAAVALALGQPLDPHGGREADAVGALLDAPAGAVWAEIAVERHPELARLEAEALAELAAAEAERHIDDPMLTVAATVRRVDEPDGPFVYGGVVAGLTVPLTRLGAAEAERRVGRAAALRIEREQRARVLGLELAQRGAQHLRWDAELGRLRAEAMPKLAARVARTAEALRAGRATATELVVARRDLIELQRVEFELVGLLVGSALEAMFWKAALGARTPEGP